MSGFVGAIGSKSGFVTDGMGSFNYFGPTSWGGLSLHQNRDPRGHAIIRTQYTTGVSTSAVKIAKGVADGGAFQTFGTFFIVNGRDANDSADRFVDLLCVGLNGNVQDVGKKDVRSSPATRTYGTNNESLTLSMGSSSSYTISVIGFDFDTTLPAGY